MFSVVLPVSAAAEVFHVLPPSLLYVIFEKGLPFSSRPCVGNTSVPSLMVIPWPGAGAQSHHFSCLHIPVRLTGLLHVIPSSVLFVIKNWLVCLTSKPG